MMRVWNTEKKQLRDVLEALGNNATGLLWRVVDDMAYNGHTIEVRSSNQFCHVIIDDRYYRIAPNDGRVMYSRDSEPEKAYMPLDYVMNIVLDEPREGDENAKHMLDAGWERDKSFASEDEAEDYAWREYESKDKPCIIYREFMDNEHGFGFFWTVWV